MFDFNDHEYLILYLPSQTIARNMLYDTKFILRIFSFDTSDGIQKQEEGEFRNPGTDQESLVVKGSYSYVGNDGNTYSVKYTADENGFQPEGVNLPSSAGVKKLTGVPPSPAFSYAAPDPIDRQLLISLIGSH